MPRLFAFRAAAAAIGALAIIVGAAAVPGACGSNGGGSSAGGASGGGSAAATSNLDTAKAVEAQVTVAQGGVAHVDTTSGGVEVLIPPGAVAQDMTLVVTPLLKPDPPGGKPLTAGVSIVQKGNEDQHVALKVPAFVSFTLPGTVSKKAHVVTFTPGTQGQRCPTSIVATGGTTTVTGEVPGFTGFRVDSGPDYHPVTLPDYRWLLEIDGKVTDTKGPLRWITEASGTLHSMGDFKDMKGWVGFTIEAWVKQGSGWAKEESNEIDSQARMTETSMRFTNKAAGQFVFAGYGEVDVSGEVVTHGTATVPGASSGFGKSAVGTGKFPMVATTTALPAKVGASVPAQVTIWIGGRKDTFSGKVIWANG